MREFLQPMFGETGALIVQFTITLAVVLVLIVAAVWLIRAFSAGRFGGGTVRGRQPRLSVVDALSIDGRRRLVLIRRDQIEHLLLIGGPTDVVVEPAIHRAPREARPRPDAPRPPQPGRVPPEPQQQARPIFEARRPPPPQAAAEPPPPPPPQGVTPPAFPEAPLEPALAEPRRRRPPVRLPFPEEEPEAALPPLPPPVSAEPEHVPEPPPLPEPEPQPARGRLVPPFLLNRRERETTQSAAEQAARRAAERPPVRSGRQPPERLPRSERVERTVAPIPAPRVEEPFDLPPPLPNPDLTRPGDTEVHTAPPRPATTPAPTVHADEPIVPPPPGRLSRLEPVFDEEDTHGLGDIPGGPIEQEPVFSAPRRVAVEPVLPEPPDDLPEPVEPAEHAEPSQPAVSEQPEAAKEQEEQSPIGDLEREMARLLGEISGSRGR